MITKKQSENQKTLHLNIILTSIIAVLIIVIATETIIVKTTQKKQTPEELISQGKAQNLMAPADDSVIAYYELGTIRIITAGNEENSLETMGTVLVVSPWLAYPQDDTVLYEEIARKRSVFKGIFQSYFSCKTKQQLLSTSESTIVQELKELINNQLALGKINDIYFTDYIFL